MRCASVALSSWVWWPSLSSCLSCGPRRKRTGLRRPSAHRRRGLIPMTTAVLNSESTEPDFYHAATKHRGILAWILSTDHKRIGILYLVTMMFFFTVAVTIGVLMRLEMLTPGRTIVGPQTYNTFFTLHGIIMIFLFII